MAFRKIKRTEGDLSKATFTPVELGNSILEYEPGMYIDFNLPDEFKELKFFMGSNTMGMRIGPLKSFHDLDQCMNKASLLLPKEAIICKEQYSEIISRIAREPEFMKQLDPFRFEEIVAELLSRMGFDVNHTKQTRDGGFDILAIGHTPIGPHKIGVECKRYTENKVGAEIVRNIYAVKMMRHFNQAMIVTTSSFTKDAYLEIKPYSSEILLKDKVDLSKWCNEYSSSKY
jgi:HJR/Mrr/RecB family endonuclease